MSWAWELKGLGTGEGPRATWNLEPPTEAGVYAWPHGQTGEDMGGQTRVRGHVPQALSLDTARRT